jgi:branched-subunit amino acid transport protein AzlD
VARAAAWAGLSVLAALTVRSVATHQDASLPPLGAAPLVAAGAVGLALLLAHRGRSVLLAVGAGAVAYLLLSGLVSGLVSGLAALTT